MLLGVYQFFCRLENDVELPVFKGSTFRGVFGRALKKVVCALKRQECETCLLRGRCLYTLVFETLLAKPPPEGARVIPPPSSETFSLKVTIETPLRLKFENRLHADLPFHILLRAMRPVFP